jgi:hypothetical protein
MNETYSSFDVEYARVTPAVLIITDQGSLRISGERSLAGTGKPKEYLL